MKSYVLPLLLSTILTPPALADQPMRPDFRHGNGHVGSHLCSGVASGTWQFRGGRDMQISLVSIAPDRSSVTIVTRNFTVVKEAQCQPTRAGAILNSLDPSYPFTLNVAYDGNMIGVVSNIGFNGRLAMANPPAPPMPAPPMPAPPYRPSDLCSGVINGTWAFRGGRDMTVTLVRTGRGQISVSVSQRNGAFAANGSCVPNGSGVSVSFSDGGQGVGQLFIDYNGRASGNVQGVGYQGQLQ